MKKYLVDTNVWIDYLKQDVDTVDFIESLENYYISDIILGEILQGYRNKTELKVFLSLAKGLKIFYVNKKISKLAIKLLEKHALASGINILDALIAATAIENKLVLVTKNQKHFKMIKRLKVYKS